MAALDHPHIVSLVDSFQEEEHLYIVAEFCAVPHLLDYLCQSSARVDGRRVVPEASASVIARQCLRALGHCHDHGLVHRDVKPENLMISEGAVKLIDFGLAVPVGESVSREQDQRPPGTVRYMAPEALRWGEPAASMDMWSLGATLFLVLTGDLLYHTEDAEQARACLGDADYVRGRIRESSALAASGSAADLLLRMLEHDHEKRITVREALAHPFILEFTDEHLANVVAH